MANLFWVGGTATYDGVTNHFATTSGGVASVALPTSADTVTFNTASNATAYSVTISAVLNCSDLTIGNPAAGVITMAGSSAINIFGNVSFATGMTRTYTGTITFSATASGKTITMNGVTLASTMTFNGVGGGWTLQDALTTTGVVTLTNGSLDTNGKTCSFGNLVSNNSNTRTLTLGASSITITGNFSTGLDFTVTTGLTFNAGTSTIILAVNSSVFTMTPGGLSFFNFTINSSANGPYGLSSNFTVTNLLSFAGTNRVYLYSTTAGVSRTITAAAFTTFQNIDLSDIIGAGAASWSGTSIGDAGGNSGITFTTPVTRFWVAFSGGNYSATSSWSTSNGGASGASVPLPQDTATFTALSITSAARTITIDRLVIPGMDLTNVLNSPAVAVSAGREIRITGSMILVAGMTQSNSGNGWQFIGRGAFTFSSPSITWLSNTNPTKINCANGSVTLGADVSFGGTNGLTVLTGTFDTSNFNITSSGAFTFSSGTGTNTRVINMGTGTWTFSGTGLGWSASAPGGDSTINVSSSTIKYTDASASSKSFTGGGVTYNNLWLAVGAGSGSITISGNNTFNDFKDDGTVAHSILFSAGSTNSFSTFTVSGTVGNQITLNSTSTSTFNLVKLGLGNVSRDFLNIQHSIATPGTTWYAGTGSTNNQATVVAGRGWIFTVPPTTYIKGNFFFGMM